MSEVGRKEQRHERPPHYRDIAGNAPSSGQRSNGAAASDAYTVPRRARGDGAHELGTLSEVQEQ